MYCSVFWDAVFQNLFEIFTFATVYQFANSEFQNSEFQNAAVSTEFCQPLLSYEFMLWSLMVEIGKV